MSSQQQPQQELKNTKIATHRHHHHHHHHPTASLAATIIKKISHDLKHVSTASGMVSEEQLRQNEQRKEERKVLKNRLQKKKDDNGGNTEDDDRDDDDDDDDRHDGTSTRSDDNTNNCEKLTTSSSISSKNSTNNITKSGDIIISRESATPSRKRDDGDSATNTRTTCSSSSSSSSQSRHSPGAAPNVVISSFAAASITNSEVAKQLRMYQEHREKLRLQILELRKQVTRKTAAAAAVANEEEEKQVVTSAKAKDEATTTTTEEGNHNKNVAWKDSTLIPDEADTGNKNNKQPHTNERKEESASSSTASATTRTAANNFFSLLTPSQRRAFAAQSKSVFDDTPFQPKYTTNPTAATTPVRGKHRNNKRDRDENDAVALDDGKQSPSKKVKENNNDNNTPTSSAQLRVENSNGTTCGRIIDIPDGQYLPLRKLGSGAFGDVFLVAWHPSIDAINSVLQRQQEIEQEKNRNVASTTPIILSSGKLEEQKVITTATDDDVNKNNNHHHHNNTNKNNTPSAYATSPGGLVSGLSSTSLFVRGRTDDEMLPRETIFVCKIEPEAVAQERLRDEQSGVQRKDDKSESEECILANCAHPNIVGFVDSFVYANRKHLVMEYVDGGDLKQELRSRLNGNSIVMNIVSNHNPKQVAGQQQQQKVIRYIAEESVLYIAVQILLALEYLHRHNILHRDLATKNILISKNWVVKLADFGFSKSYNYDVDGNIAIAQCGTPYYLSPELLLKKPYSQKSEMWSFGIILYEIIALHRPFREDNLQTVFRSVVHDEPRPLPRLNISVDLLILLDKLLSKDPDKRPSAKEVLKMPLFRAPLEQYLRRTEKLISQTTIPVGGNNNNNNNPAKGGGGMNTVAVPLATELDKVWLRVLKGHVNMIFADELTSAKSRFKTSRSRSRSKERKSMASSLVTSASLSAGASKEKKNKNPGASSVI